MFCALKRVYPFASAKELSIFLPGAARFPGFLLVALRGGHDEIRPEDLNLYHRAARLGFRQHRCEIYSSALYATSSPDFARS